MSFLRMEVWEMIKFSDVEMNKQIEATYLANNNLFNSEHPTIKISDIYRYLPEASYAMVNTKTLNRHIKEINTYVSATYYEKNNLYNPALLDKQTVEILKSQNLINTKDAKVSNYVKKLQSLRPLSRFFYYRTFSFLPIENPSLWKNERYNIRSYEIPLLFSPLLIGILNSTKREKSGYQKTKAKILETATEILNEENYFSFFTTEEPLSLVIDTEYLKTAYSHWIDLLLPDKLYNLYVTLLEKKNINNNSGDPFARFNNLPLTQIISSLPHQFFLSQVGYEIYYSEILNLLDNSSDLYQDIENVREKIMRHEFNLWNQVAQQYEK